MAEQVKVKTMEIRNVSVDIYVATWRDSATFQAFRAGSTDTSFSARLAEAETLPELVKRLKQSLREKAATVKVPFEEVTAGEVRQGVARGIHQRDGDVLVTWADGVKDQLGKWGNKNILSPLSRSTRARIAEAAGIAREATLQAERAQKWLDALLKPHELNLHHAVSQAISERAREMAVAEEPEKVTA